RTSWCTPRARSMTPNRNRARMRSMWSSRSRLEPRPARRARTRPMWSSRSTSLVSRTPRAEPRTRQARSGRPTAPSKSRSAQQNKVPLAMQSTLTWPIEESRRVPGWVYTDPGIYAREQERIFGGRSWNYVGLTAEVPQRGDFIQTYVGENPVVVVRDQDRQIRVFVNRCTHRGAQFCVEPRGHADSFVC